MDCKERILSDEYADGVVDFPVDGLLEAGSDACYIALDDKYSVVYQNRNYASDLSESIYQYRYIPHIYGLMQMQESRIVQGFDPGYLVESGIRQIQAPPLELRGKGTIIAIIDTGIDYRDPVFLDEAGNSRILAIWDQTNQVGNPPDGFFFGTEYKKEDIDRALRSEDPLRIVPVRDNLLHGSIMAAVAAGGLEEGISGYTGAAPEAEIVVVKLKECKDYLREYYLVPKDAAAYEETDIMLGIKYADQFAESFVRPLVICLGIGTNMGDHAGNSMLAGYLNRIAEKRSRAVVICGGNEGLAAHHYQGDISNITPGSAQDVEIRVGEGERGFMLEFWGVKPDVFYVAVRSPGGETIPPIRLGLEQTNTYRFVFESTVLTVQSVLVEPGAGEELILFRVQDPTPGIWNFRVFSSGNVSRGRFHMWLPIREFLNADTYFLEPEPDITLTEPAMARSCLSVSNYDHKNGSFFQESGRGFSRDGAVKPDVAAPGVDVPTPYGLRTGSSISAAVTAGAAAQFLQWAVVEKNSPLANTETVKNYFIKGALRMPDQVYPNREWGFGKLNVLGTFDVLRG